MQTSLPPHTEVFESYWYFAAERQRIWARRAAGVSAPLTADPVLQSFRFTNAYRVLDRVTQALLTDVVFDRPHGNEDTVLRALLFKIFNRITTWKHLEEKFGEITAQNFDARAFGAELSRLRSSGVKIYSNAYIVPPIRSADGPKHQGHLQWLEGLLQDGFVKRVQEATALHTIFGEILEYEGFGPFLAFQFAIDLAYTDITAATEDHFVVAGPGAIDGLTKCFGGVSPADAASLIMQVTDEQDIWFEHLGIDFPSLFGRRLRPIDCQNLFCEISKYSRVAHPGVLGSSGRLRIKQHYRRDPAPIPPPVLPPKWGTSPILAAPGPRRLVASQP